LFFPARFNLQAALPLIGLTIGIGWFVSIYVGILQNQAYRTWRREERNPYTYQYGFVRAGIYTALVGVIVAVIAMGIVVLVPPQQRPSYILNFPRPPPSLCSLGGRVCD
jgi:hypothetical protein